MSRKGYDAEYKTKKELEQTYGKGNVIKVAIGGSSDYIVICCGELLKICEVKTTKKKKYYPTKREEAQIKEITRLAQQHHVPCELYIYYTKGKGKKTEKEVKVIYTPE